MDTLTGKLSLAMRRIVSIKQGIAFEAQNPEML
jgi:hypothetical protein